MARYQRNKFKVSPPNQRSYKGRTYDSKAEMLFAQRLDLLVSSGDVVDYCEQPKSHLAGELWYRPDFLVIEPAKAYFVDVKGVETDGFKKVKAAWQGRRGLDLHVIKRKRENFETIEIVRGLP